MRFGCPLKHELLGILEPIVKAPNCYQGLTFDVQQHFRVVGDPATAAHGMLWWAQRLDQTLKQDRLGMHERRQAANACATRSTVTHSGQDVVKFEAPAIK
jgi:hypothetical protein